MMRFYGEELLAPSPTPKLEDHPFSAVRDFLFNIFVSTLHIGGRSSIRSLRTGRDVVTGPTYHMASDDTVVDIPTPTATYSQTTDTSLTTTVRTPNLLRRLPCRLRKHVNLRSTQFVTEALRPLSAVWSVRSLDVSHYQVDLLRQT